MSHVNLWKVLAFISFMGWGWNGAGIVSAQTDLELAEFYYNEGSYPQAKLYLDGI